ncbi:unnamed protein product [Sphagnum jensenii]|uniref:BAH domain-containing protein n=1 Tax=Sphagnum jensenii TaxID=128206 RepID=A0ABP1AS30_9BRYO
MHGQQSEERQRQQQQQHMWSPPSQRSSPGNNNTTTTTTGCSSAYTAFSKGDRNLSIGDTALFQAGNAPPFIGILRKVTVEKDVQVKLSVNWLYRPADVKLAKGAALEAAPNEVFYSFHKDDISAASFLHPCKVAFLRKGVELPTGVSSFVCRRVYDTASKCLWWLTDRDYTDEHQKEVDLLLERTKLEMQAAVQSGGPSPRALTGPISSSPQPKVSAESVQNATIYSLPGKGKKREHADQNLDPSKRERNVKFDDPDTSTLKRERSMKLDEIAAILDKDGGLLNVGVVERLVQLMPNDPHDGTGKVADVLAHRTMLAGVIAATENAECLNQFVSLGGLRLLDEWLQEAHKGKVGDGGSPKECDKGVEDLLLGLLRALDRLPVDLKALKTCSVGKSVNHLRSHKNLEIQKKARRLVDVWKKRVDAEMKASGEAKPGSGHGISWSYKQSAAELVHPLTKIGSGGIPEVAVKSSGAFAGNAKVTLNGTNSGDAPVKPLSVVPAVSKTASALSPDLPAAKDSNNSKLPALNISPDMPANPVKEEKSSSSSHTLSNGHSWGSAAGKGSGNTTWKEDVKTSVPLCVNGSSKASSAGSPRLPNGQNKVVPGASVSGGSKEAGGGKPLVWTRSAGTEKAVGSVATPESSSSQQRLIVRIPNPGKSPAQTSGGPADVAAPASRSSSPSVLERHSSTSLVDVLETKNRPQTGSQAASSPEGAIDVKAGDGGKSGTGSIEDKMKPQSNAPPVNALESEKKVSNESAPGLVGVKEEADCMSKETLTSSCSSAFRGAGEALPQVVDGGNNANTASAAGSVEDGPLGHSQVSPMEVDDGAMSLLATAAAAAEVGAIAGGTGTLEKADTGGQMLKGEQEANVNSSVDAEPGLINGSFCGNAAMEIDGAPQSKDHSEPGITQSALNHEIPSTDGSKAGGKIEQKEQHDGGSMERQGSVSHLDANKEVESLSVEQAGGGERGVKKLIVQECAGQACEASSDTPSTLMSMAELPVENRRAIEVTAKALNEQHPSVRDYSVSGMNDLESKLTSKFGKRDLISEERNLLRTLSKESSARDLCNGVGGAERDYRANMGSSLESHMQEEKNGKRRGQEAGQLFGRRGDSDAQRIAELVSGFPEEDVLEVARQAANEVEQMQENCKPVSSSSSERDGQDAQTKGTPNGAHSDAAVGGSDTSERPDFDLNEGFAAEDSPQDDSITVPPTSAALIIQPAYPIASTASASGVAAPIAVLAATKGTFIPPLSPMRIKGDLGWKGSAATSAFRPAEPRRTPDRQHSNAESLASDANLSLNANAVKQARPLLEFDLNVADDRVMEDVGVATTTLSSQGSVLESSSSAHPLSNGGYGSLRASPGQAPASSGYGTARPNLDLDLNRMDDSEECGTPFYSDARAAEGAASLAPSNNSTSKPARRVMDFDLNDGPSFEEVGVDDPASQSLPLRKPASNAAIPVGMSGTRMRGEGMNLSSWFSPPGNSFPGVAVPAFPPAPVSDPGYSVAVPAFPPAPVSDPGYSVAAAAAAHSFLNVGSASATAVGPFNAEIFRAGPTLSAPPAVVYPPAERVTFGTYGPFPVFGGSTGFLSSSLPFPTASAPFVDTSRPVPFPAISSQLGSQPTVSSTYVRPPLLMGMTEAVAADNSGGAWSRRSLDLNAGPELADTDSMRDDVMHGRLPPLHPGGPAVFNEQMRATLAQVSANSGLTTPLKRKEPEGGWNCYTGNGGFKQATWR